jgi:hypothetical protein
MLTQVFHESELKRQREAHLTSLNREREECRIVVEQSTQVLVVKLAVKLVVKLVVKRAQGTSHVTQPRAECRFVVEQSTWVTYVDAC